LEEWNYFGDGLTDRDDMLRLVRSVETAKERGGKAVYGVTKSLEILNRTFDNVGEEKAAALEIGEGSGFVERGQRIARDAGSYSKLVKVHAGIERARGAVRGRRVEIVLEGGGGSGVEKQNANVNGTEAGGSLNAGNAFADVRFGNF
jgi:hypothetical protein